MINVPPGKTWRSTVARTLIQQHNKQPAPKSRQESVKARSKKGASAPECAALLAEQLLHGEKLQTILSKPIDLMKVCSSIGLSVKYQPLAMDGLLQQQESGYLAIIDATAKPSQQRMSLAHEIAHLTLYRATRLQQAFGHVSQRERKSTETLEIELLCDHFASELLMPSEIWDNTLDFDGLSLTTLLKLKESYAVSITSAAKRIVEITRWNCSIIIWEPIYEHLELVAVKPVRFFGKLRHDRFGANEILERKPDLVIPGSPFYTIERKLKSAGKVTFLNRAYLAHSDLIGSKHFITLIVPESVGWHIMFGRRNSTSISDL